jgi:hypothetical protein
MQHSARSLLAALVLAAPASAQTFDEHFDLPTANLAIFGLVYTADFLAAPAGTIEAATLELHYTTGALDAADLRLSLQAPSEGLPFWTVTGADLGWSGSGTFDATVSTDLLDGAIDLGDPAPDFSLYALTLSAVGGQPLSGQLQSSAYTIAVDRWLAVGGALAGTGGTAPILDPTATLAPGSPLTLAVHGAPPGAPVLLALGISKLEQPFLGGIAIPDPLAIVPLAADGAGDAALSLTWPAVPKGISLYAQAWIADAGAPQGFAATAGVKSVTP